MSAAVAVAAREPMRSRIGATTYLTPKDSLNDDKPVQALRKVGEACIAAGEIRLVIELTHVRAVDGHALEMLLDLQDELLRIGGSLKLGHVSALLQDVFQITGIADYIGYSDGPTGTSSTKLPVLVQGRRKFGDLLLARGLVTEEQIKEALSLQSERGEHIGKIIAAKGWVPEQKLLEALGEQLGLPVVDLRPGSLRSRRGQALEQECREAARRVTAVQGARRAVCGDVTPASAARPRRGCTTRSVHGPAGAGATS